ncbi:hypothetical protein GCM10007170_10680 [Arthrobacter liuii]|uniref:Uncharacterized protein n=1 Tax=Arthrobacter liuii TaxID=1476996 RepID=A0ABQ2ALT8_9MICC|nr:hypothetical protein GCM10007170_10680 [Arthrobacter liuii]
MSHDAGFVVSGAPSIEPSVLLDGGERPGFPQGLVAHGLDVMVGIEQDGWFSFAGRTAGDDGRPAWSAIGLVNGQHLDITNPGTPKEFRDGLGAAFQGRAPKAGPRDSRDGNEFLEPRQRLVEGTVYGRTEIFRPAGNLRARS